MGQKTQYKDGLIDRLAMNLFRRKMQTVTGARTKETGYDAFVDVSKALMRGKSAQEQQAAVSRVLLSLIPRHLPYIIRTFFKPTRLSLELNALFTPSIFSWLVGPAEVVEVEVNGVKQKTGVKIKKCRYLEASGCVGMCVNVCKVPTQDFFTKEFGLPLTMNPNFDDMSCEMVFGQVPPPIEEDKAFQQPCFATLCSMAADEKPKCPKLLTAEDGLQLRK
ncbi:hypothetical protein KFL_001370030 [Klebsormidium nitens]|uniref:Beta-carotene isomerase D27-like C-terminal domain-containing protein n=2 Tax=Klebsormidium TaxID=3174 RepID=A0A1Y1HY91_KLENI|nr:hypothetical protein KFL_001370030 [Klebsormidium nitens]|eukprot:GAQ83133.1 hypothetical protein KFL_001370030 [Klebsormidium nitens]